MFRGTLRLAKGLTPAFFEIDHAEVAEDNDLIVDFPLPGSAEGLFAFQHSDDGKAHRAAFEKLLWQLFDFLQSSNPAHRDCINNFITDHLVPAREEHLPWSRAEIVLFKDGVRYLSGICQLIKNDKICLDARKSSIKNLIEDIGVCGVGACSYIVDAYTALQALLYLPQEFLNFRRQMVQQLVVNIMQGNGLIDTPGMEVHYVLAVMNHFANELGLQKIHDPFIDSCQTNIVNQLKVLFPERLVNELTLENLLDKIITELDLNAFAAKMKKTMANGDMTANNECRTDFINKLKKYGVNAIDLLSCIVMTQNESAVICLSYSAYEILFHALRAGLASLGYADPVDKQVIYENDKYKVFNEPGFNFRFATIKLMETGEIYPFSDYLLRLVLNDDKDSMVLYSFMMNNICKLKIVNRYFAGYIASCEYQTIGSLLQESRIISFLLSSRHRYWVDYRFHPLLPVPSMKKYLRKLLAYRICHSLVDELLNYYFNLDADADMMDYFLGIADLDKKIGVMERMLLHNISHYNSVGLAKELIHRGAFVDAADICGSTPLMIAARSGTFLMASLFLDNDKANADPNSADCEQMTALHHACRHDQPIIMLLLRKHGANPDALTIYGYSPLHYACRNGNFRSCSKIIEWSSLSLNTVANDGATPLSLAIAADNWSVVNLLLKSGADISLLDMKDADALFAMLINEYYPQDLTIQVFDAVLSLYISLLQSKLKVIKDENPDVVGMQQAAENVEWNSHRYLRDMRLFASRKLQRMIKNEEPQIQNASDLEYQQCNWDMALVSVSNGKYSRRMRMFVTVYDELVKRGMVQEYDPSFQVLSRI